MAHGLDENLLLVIQWRWTPVPPLPLTEALPPVAHRDDALFLATEPPVAEMASFRFSFPQLAKQNPDLRFYRLIQIFNTPLLSLSTRDAGRNAFAYWRGVPPMAFRDEFKWAHLWFFKDGDDGDDLVVEYGFEGGLTLHSRLRTRQELVTRYAEICRRVGAS